MIVSWHYCPRRFSNCYIISQDYEGKKDAVKEALIIDPAQIHAGIINFIEKNNYVLKAALITHDHNNHSSGLLSLSRIYENVEIYAANPVVQSVKTTMIRDGDNLSIAGFNVSVISTPGHSADSVVFHIEHALFTGDTLSAALIGNTASSYAATTEISVLQNKIFSLRENLLVFPSHGPPSTLDTEKVFNIGIRRYENNRRRTVKKSFNLDLLE